MSEEIKVNGNFLNVIDKVQTLIGTKIKVPCQLVITCRIQTYQETSDTIYISKNSQLHKKELQKLVSNFTSSGFSDRADANLDKSKPIDLYVNLEFRNSDNSVIKVFMQSDSKRVDEYDSEEFIKAKNKLFHKFLALSIMIGIIGISIFVFLTISEIGDVLVDILIPLGTGLLISLLIFNYLSQLKKLETNFNNEKSIIKRNDQKNIFK